MKCNNSVLWTFGIIIILASCKNESIVDHKSNKFLDATIQEIYQLQDERDSEKLLSFLGDKNPRYRREAALAFGSIQDSLAINELTQLLNDEYNEVKIAAAYALGQIGNSAAEKGLMRAADQETVPIVRKEILESIGKCINPEGLEYLEEDQPQDSLEKEGLSWGIYRAGIKGSHSERIIDKAVDLLDRRNTYETRLGAAHFLYRAQDLNLDSKFDQIAESANHDPAPTVRMASARALGKIKTEESLSMLSKILEKDTDYRVRVNSILAMNGHEYDTIQDALWNSLHDQNINTSIAAASFLLNLPEVDTDTVLNISKSITNWRVRSTLLSLAYKQSPNKTISSLIKNVYELSSYPYEKAALLRAMGQHPESTLYIIDELFKADHKAVSTAAAQALAQIRNHPEFPGSLESTFAETLKKCIGSGDLALVGIAGGILRNENYDYKTYFQDFRFLYEAKSNLVLPKDNEAMQALQRTIDFFEGSAATPVTNEYNNPIDWTMAKLIAPDQIAVISTTKGTIHIELMINQSPGSTLNFVKLVNRGYYNGKNFHRVVPNFVIQGGCPRGDGWGGEDYSIRSELGMTRYREGHVGMASAGKDTEGVQWFITHSPTPHLDGNYSIFGKVVKGMEVVHKIEVGDQIKSITLN